MHIEYGCMWRNVLEKEPYTWGLGSAQEGQLEWEHYVGGFVKIIH